MLQPVSAIIVEYEEGQPGASPWNFQVYGPRSSVLAGAVTVANIFDGEAWRLTCHTPELGSKVIVEPSQPM